MARTKVLTFETLEQRTLLAGITDGPLVGAVNDISAKVFVRTTDKAQVSVQFSTSPALTDALATPPTKTTKATDLTAIVPLMGLAPETTYYYRVMVGGVAQQKAPYPSFQTFVTPGQERDFSFAVFGDLADTTVDSTVGAPAYAAAAADAPSFVMQIGDFDHRNPRKLSKMRKMHRDVRGLTTAAGADFHTHIASAFPVFHVWDDHDYASNNADKTFGRKAEALQAFKEYYPLPNLPNPAGIWHSFANAQADFFMLDLRSQRDPVSDAKNAAKSMLDGDDIPNGQKSWLKTSLLQSTAKWKFIVSSVPFNPTVGKKDGWAEYPDERNEILNFIQENNITGVIVLSADIHLGGALDNGTNSTLPELNVPHTNLDSGHADTTTRPGTWSNALFSGANNPGYGWVHVTSDHVTLEIRGADGSVRASMVVNDNP